MKEIYDPNICLGAGQAANRFVADRRKMLRAYLSRGSARLILTACDDSAKREEAIAYRVAFPNFKENLWKDKLKRLKKLVGEAFELQRIAAVLTWTGTSRWEMPVAAAANRARQTSLISCMAHEKLTCNELGELLNYLVPEMKNLDPESDDYCCLIRLVNRDYQRHTKVPSETCC